MRVLLIAALPMALTQPTLAHHGWGSYDSQKVLKVQAAIVEVSYANPHVEIVVLHQGKRWTATLAPIFRMQNRGLPQDALTKGKTVTVEGYPSKVTDGELRVERITVDGKTIELR